MKVLITGGAGYVGSHVVKVLGESGYNILIIDNLSTGYREAVLFGDLVVADLSDKDAIGMIINRFKPDAVMHLAASVRVDESLTKPLQYYRNNVINTINLLEAMADNNVKNLIFSSTAAVYGNPVSVPIMEDAPMQPLSPYGSSKATVEIMLRELATSDPAFRYVSLRYFNVAGASRDMRLGQYNNESTHLMKMALKAAKGEQDRLQVFGTDYPTVDGTCIRDFVHVDDIAMAHYLALEYLQDGGRSDVFNCGYGIGFSVKEVIDIVKEVTGVDFKVELASRRSGDVPIVIADNTKIKSVLNWTPKFKDLRLIVETVWQWELRRC